MTELDIERLKRDAEYMRDAIGPHAVNFTTGQVIELIAEIERLRSMHGSAEPVLYRCFHCLEEFADSESAALHFGKTELQNPACLINIAEYRAMEQRMLAYNQEDAEIHREMANLQSSHTQALKREEEIGYARGLRDGAKYPNEVAAAPQGNNPVHFFRQHVGGNWIEATSIRDPREYMDNRIFEFRTLYTAPPAPVSADIDTAAFVASEKIMEICAEKLQPSRASQRQAQIQCVVIDAFRSAPVSAQPVAREAIRLAVQRITEIQKRDGGRAWQEAKSILFSDLTFVVQELIDALAKLPPNAMPTSPTRPCACMGTETGARCKPGCESKAEIAAKESSNADQA